VLEILVRCGARERAQDEARRYRDMALADVEHLPISEERRGELRSLMGSVIPL
jgi:geranylgeranyl pyrophosphate synthase